MKFEFYALKYDPNRKKIEKFNIFNNILIDKVVNKEVSKYCRAPSRYRSYDSKTKEYVYGFEGFCLELKRTFAWQFMSRRQYEVYIGDAFEEDVDKYEKIDIYYQIEPNVPAIAREAIYQYKQHQKELRAQKEEK